MVFYNNILFTKEECNDIKEMVTEWNQAGFEIEDINVIQKMDYEPYNDKNHFESF